MITLPIRGIISDLDSTLTYGFDRPDLEGTPMPGVIHILDYLREYRYPVRVCSNQAGPLWERCQPLLAAKTPGYVSRNYPSVEKVAEKLARALYSLHLGSVPVFVAVHDPRLDDVATSEIAQVVAEELRDASE